MKLQVWGGDIKVYSDFSDCWGLPSNMFFNSQLYSQKPYWGWDQDTYLQSCPYLIKNTSWCNSASPVVPNSYGTRDLFLAVFAETVSGEQRVGRWFWNDSNVLHLLYTLFLLLYYISSTSDHTLPHTNKSTGMLWESARPRESGWCTAKSCLTL